MGFDRIRQGTQVRQDEIFSPNGAIVADAIVQRHKSWWFPPALLETIKNRGKLEMMRTNRHL
jgi:hypothetical protein